MKYSEYIKITDKDCIEAIDKIRESYRNFIFTTGKKVRDLGLGFEGGAYSRDYASAYLCQKRFEGCMGPDSLYHQIRDKFKPISTKRSDGLWVYAPRKANKDFYKDWLDIFGEGADTHTHLNGLIPIVFSEVVEDSKFVSSYGDVCYYGCPIADIYWKAIDGSVLMRLAWFGRTKSDYTLDPRHERIMESEYLRLKGE